MICVIINKCSENKACMSLQPILYMEVEFMSTYNTITTIRIKMFLENK
jgi:hypothetical protein